MQTALLRASAPRHDFAAPAAPGAYFGLGVWHILEGYDHLLFVFGLVLLCGFCGRLAGAVTGFTLGHSLSLAGVTLGAVSLPSGPVEACIALSILLLAVEVAHPDRAGWLSRWPLLLAGGFGVLHGFGFAGALGDLGLPAQGRGWALLGFNLGVEAGQLLFLAVLWPLSVVARRRPRLQPVGVYLVGGLGAYWSLDRIAGLFGGSS